MRGTTPYYEDETGYIWGYEHENGFFWVDQFVIRPKYRGKGLARNLAEHLPIRCMLDCLPIEAHRTKKAPGLDLAALKKFYASLGFKPYWEPSGDYNLMVRIRR